MASLALGVAGAVAGSYFGPVGAQVGFLVGSYLGGMLEGGPHTEGPRINDKSVQASTYGIPIPITYGTVRIAGNIIWAADLREVPVDQGGGKGGPSPTETTFTYYGTFAVSLCANEITAVRKIWADGKLIYDASDGNSGPLGLSAAQAFFQNLNIDDVALPFIVYPGNETQLPDPTMEAYLGAGNVPAYRGQAYCVFTDLPLERFGNRIPNLSFEVVAVGTVFDPVTQYTSPSGMRLKGVYIPITNETWIQMQQSTTSDPYLVRLNADTGALVGYVYPASPTDHYAWNGNPIYDPVEKVVYVSTQTAIGSPAAFMVIDAVSGVEISKSTNLTRNLALKLIIDPLLGLIDTDLYDFGASAIRHIDKSDGSVIDSVVVPFFDIQQLVFDRVSGQGWIRRGTSSRDQLWVLDPTGLAVTLAYTHTQTLDWFAYDTLRDVLWMSTNSSALVVGWDVAEYEIIAQTITMAREPQYLVYDEQRDLLEGTSYVTSGGYFFANFVSTGEQYKDIHENYSSIVIMPGKNAILLIGGGTSGVTDHSMVKIRFDVVTSDAVLLADIVTDLCVRAGLEVSDIDVSELLDEVLGYAVTRQGPCRDNVQQLATGFLFDGVESDDIVKFPKRGRTSAVTIPADDCAAHAPGGAPPDILTKTRAQDVELPQRLNVIYAAVAIDYAQGNQLSERLAGPAPTSAQMMAFESPIVMSDDYARELADVLMFNAWTERTRYQFATSIKYTAYEPTDVVTVVDRVLRITRKHEASGLVRFEGVEDDLAIYAQDASGVAVIRPPQVIESLVPSFFTPIDCALLRDVDNAPGFYAAVGGYVAGWGGAVLYKSFDGGATYVQVQAFTNQPTEGVAVAALGDFSGGNIYDELNALTVSLWAGTTVSSSTRSAVNNGANVAALKSGDRWEILQYRDATLNANGTYTLRGLLRGRLGSEYAMGGHAAGDAFVLLTVPTIGDIPMSVAEIDAQRIYKPVTIGDSLANTAAQAFTAECVRLMPLAPVHLGGGRNASGDVLGHWRRRSRMGWGWHDGADIMLGEDSELYDVEIYDATYTTLKRTFSSLTTQAVTYTAAEQTTDFGSPQATVYGKVYQVSAIVGRGFPATFAF